MKSVIEFLFRNHYNNYDLLGFLVIGSMLANGIGIGWAFLFGVLYFTFGGILQAVMY